MSAVLMTPPYLQFFDDDGLPLAGGKVYTYTATGTFSTLKATYTDASGDTEADNPVILDASGRPTSGGGSIWLSGTYDFKVTDSLDNTIETTLDVTAFTTLPSASDAYFQSFSGNGSATAFTTSSDLGTDEKAIYVWVDAGAGKGYDIQNPSAYTINGTTLTFNSAPASGTNNIYVSAPSLLVGAASSAAADAAASAAAAAASEAQAGDYAGQLVITSSSSIAIGTGSKTFTVSSGLSLSNGQFIVITSDAAPTTNYMWGQISSYSSTTLQVTVSATGGSGTYADWTMYLTGARGATGATGSISDLSGVPSGTVAVADKFIFDDVSAADVTRSCTVQSVLNLVYANATGTLDIGNGGTGQTTAATAFSALKQAADTSTTGVVQLATNSEVAAGSSSTKVSPVSSMAYHQGVAKAWVNFNGTGTVAIRDSYNVSSITDNGTGDYTVNLSITMANSNYCTIGTAGNPSQSALKILTAPATASPSTTAVRILGSDAGANIDIQYMQVVIFGDL